MRHEVFEQALAWARASGEPVALATIVATSGSAARLPGAAMAVSASGEVAGSVSGGCVEAAVYELARSVIDDGRLRLARYGVTAEGSLEPGLTCGGEIEVCVRRLDAASLGRVVERMAAGRPVALATVLTHPDETVRGWELVVSEAGGGAERAGLDARLAAHLATDVAGLLASGVSGCLTYAVTGDRLGDDVRVFVQSWAPPPRLILFGAVDFAAALTTAGAFSGYRVTVCDARPVFTTPARFPAAAEVVVDWPHRYLRAEAEAGRLDARTAVCVLTHDARFDVPALQTALGLDLGYVGAMGSRRTHGDRLERLHAAGVTPDQLARLRSPLGLDLGASTPEETAISILAEIIASRHGGTGRPLGQVAGAIHRAPVESLPA